MQNVCHYLCQESKERKHKNSHIIYHKFYGDKVVFTEHRFRLHTHTHTVLSNKPEMSLVPLVSLSWLLKLMWFLPYPGEVCGLEAGADLLRRVSELREAAGGGGRIIRRRQPAPIKEERWNCTFVHSATFYLPFLALKPSLPSHLVRIWFGSFDSNSKDRHHIKSKHVRFYQENNIDFNNLHFLSDNMRIYTYSIHHYNWTAWQFHHVICQLNINIHKSSAYFASFSLNLSSTSRLISSLL